MSQIQKQNKKCIINYADGKYKDWQDRLIKSIRKTKYDGDIIALNDRDLPSDFPNFDEAPWAFKPFMFNYAAQNGYTQILWFDSSVICIRNPKKIFRKISSEGYYLFSNKISTIDKWSSDYTLEKMEIERYRTVDIPEIRAHVLGINTENIVGSEFLKEWTRYSLDGISFRGLPRNIPIADTFHNSDGQISKDRKVIGHRHDQTVASIIAHKLGMKIISKFSIDYIGEIEFTKKPIEYDCIVLQDRSYKNGQIRDIDWSNNTHSMAGKMLYFIYSIVYTISKRLYKKMIKQRC